MPAEKFVHDFAKEAGYTPIPDRAIIVTYAPANLSEKITRFFSNEFFVGVKSETHQAFYKCLEI